MIETLSLFFVLTCLIWAFQPRLCSSCDQFKSSNGIGGTPCGSSECLEAYDNEPIGFFSLVSGWLIPFIIIASLFLLSLHLGYWK